MDKEPAEFYIVKRKNKKDKGNIIHTTFNRGEAHGLAWKYRLECTNGEIIEVKHNLNFDQQGADE